MMHVPSSNRLFSFFFFFFAFFEKISTTIYSAKLEVDKMCKRLLSSTTIFAV